MGEIRGQHHSIFVDPAHTAKHASIVFSGRSSLVASTTAGQYKRIAKGGREIWLQASYNPILGPGRQAVQRW